MKKAILHILLVIPAIALAQSEPTDSISLKSNLREDLEFKIHSEDSLKWQMPKTDNMDFHQLDVDALHLKFDGARPLQLNVPELTLTPGQAVIHSWGNGEVVATGGSQSFYGLMQIDSGSIGVNQTAGPFSMYAGVMANKYGFYQGLHTQYGLNSSLTYRFNPNLSATAFGTYYFGKPMTMPDGSPMIPAMAGYYGTTKFGGYIDWQASERFGVIAGGQVERQVVNGKYMAEPIATPYVKFGRGKKKWAIGLPVGQMLHHLLRR